MHYVSTGNLIWLEIKHFLLILGVKSTQAQKKYKRLVLQLMGRAQLLRDRSLPFKQSTECKKSVFTAYRTSMSLIFTVMKDTCPCPQLLPVSTSNAPVGRLALPCFPPNDFSFLCLWAPSLASEGDLAVPSNKNCSLPRQQPWLLSPPWSNSWKQF